GTGRTDEPGRLQASLRGCNAERRCSAGLLRDRTHSESNGFPVAGDPLQWKSNGYPGDSAPGPGAYSSSSSSSRAMAACCSIALCSKARMNIETTEPIASVPPGG